MIHWNGVNAECEGVLIVFDHIVAWHEADFDPEALSRREDSFAIDADLDLHLGMLVSIANFVGDFVAGSACDNELGFGRVCGIGNGIDEYRVRLHPAETDLHCAQRLHFYPDLPGVGEVTPAQSFRISILGIVDTHYNWFARFGSPRATIKLNKASICIGIEKLDNIGSESGRALSSTYAAPFKLLIFGC